AFSIQVPNDNAVLVLSYLGYESQQVTVGAQRNLTITLVESTEELDEVVVIGYGTVKKRDLTGAVSVIDVDEMAKTGASTIAQSIQGLASGVNVRSTGNAGSDASIEIRGIGTLRNNDPLWVVDGLITSAGADFNQNDVESIQILKDASAAAIYGSGADNGVIIVNTRKGKDGPANVDFSVRESFDWSPGYGLMNAEESKEYNDMPYREGIKDGPWSGTLQDHADYDT